jgi:hypothetical protein
MTDNDTQHYPVERALLERYLLISGWQSRILSQNVKLFSKIGENDNDTLEIFLNNNSIQKDIKFALRTLSDLSEMPISKIASEISSIGFDIFSSRIPTEYVRNDTIEMRAAAVYISGMKDFLAASATTEITNDRDYKRLRKEGISYSEKCRFGHTFRGSFGFIIESPVGLNDEPRFDQVAEPIPFERRVMERIVRGFSSFQEAAASQHARPIYSATDGFSAAMCDLVADLIEEMAVSRIDLGVRFSPEWKLDSVPSPTPSFCVEYKNVELLRDASKSLRAIQEPEPVSVFGRIKRLETDGNPADLIDDPSSRDVEINWPNADNVVLRVKLSLNPTDYLQAVDAHRSGKLVSVSGLLHKTGRSWRIENYENFKIIDL